MSRFLEGGEIPGFNSISGRAGAEVRRLMFVRVGGGTGRALIRWFKVKMAKIPARYGHERTLGFYFFFCWRSVWCTLRRFFRNLLKKKEEKCLLARDGML